MTSNLTTGTEFQRGKSGRNKFLNRHSQSSRRGLRRLIVLPGVFRHCRHPRYLRVRYTFRRFAEVKVAFTEPRSFTLISLNCTSQQADKMKKKKLEYSTHFQNMAIPSFFNNKERVYMQNNATGEKKKKKYLSLQAYRTLVCGSCVYLPTNLPVFIWRSHTLLR